MKIALCGHAGSGKTTLANCLVEQYGFVKYSFADAVKQIAVEIFAVDWKDRPLLQKIGQSMREIDPYVWINVVLRQIEEDDPVDVIIDDVRYVNEESELKEEGFIIVKLVGRGYELPPEEAGHESEKEVELIHGDYTLDASRSLDEVVNDLLAIVVIEKLNEARMSVDYYRKVGEKSNKNYVRGRNFEYLAMKTLRRLGWHCMRRFGSKDEVVEGIGNVPIDITAYKNGVYLMITCKYSIGHSTTYIDDPKRDNLIKYAERFGAVPVFAGINEKRRIYFIDLRALTPLELATYRYKEKQAPDESQMEKLLAIGWQAVEICLKEYNAAEKDAKLRAKWADALIKAINIMNRLLRSAGATDTEDDLTKLLEQADKGDKNGSEG